MKGVRSHLLQDACLEAQQLKGLSALSHMPGCEAWARSALPPRCQARDRVGWDKGDVPASRAWLKGPGNLEQRSRSGEPSVPVASLPSELPQALSLTLSLLCSAKYPTSPKA